MSINTYYGGYSVDSFRLTLCENHPNFKSYPIELQRAMARLILINKSSKSYAHKTVPQAFYISCDAKINFFGRDGFNKIADGLIKTHECKQTGIGYAYTFTSECNEIIKCWSNEAANDEVLISPDNKIVKTPPRNAILSRDSNNNNAKFTTNISSIIKINTEALKTLPETLCILAANDHNYYTDERVGRINTAYAGISRMSMCSALPVGSILQPYQESSSGRLYGGGLHLQNCPRIVKIAALTSCYQYDLDNAHLSLLVQLIKIPLPAVEEYIKNKQSIRNALAVKYKVSVDVIKNALIILVYGGALSSSPMNSLGKILGDNAKYFQQDSFVRAFNNDLKIGRKELIDTARIHRGLVINRMGKGISVCEEKAKVTAHILQGAESQILNAMIEFSSGNIALLQHDSITTYQRQDIGYLIDCIQKKTGFKVSISETYLDVSKMQTDKLIESIDT